MRVAKPRRSAFQRTRRLRRWRIPLPSVATFSAGTSRCVNCGYELQVQSVESLPPCPKCDGPCGWEAVSGGDSRDDPYPDR